jgi:Flp pilus assembly protein TadG
MRRSIMQARRPGAVLVETAVVLPVVLLLLLGLLVGGMGVVRYQEVAHLAREGARYASTHAGRYAEDGQAKATGSPAIVTGADLFPTILPKRWRLIPSACKSTCLGWPRESTRR